MGNIKSQDFFFDRGIGFTGEGHDNYQTSPDGIYMSPPGEEQSQEFSYLYRSTIIEEFAKFQVDFRERMLRAAARKDFLDTPLTDALRDLLNVQQEYLQLIEIFASLHPSHIKPEQLAVWGQEVAAAFSGLILEYTIEHTKASQQIADARKNSIEDDTSAPFILLNKETGLLPLTGEITGSRCQIICEMTLEKCADAKVEKLFIDLSGVPKLDNMSAQQFFLLLNGLRLLGVTPVIAGIRPAVVKLFLQMHFDTKNIEFHHSLMHAMKKPFSY